jgi:cyclase
MLAHRIIPTLLCSGTLLVKGQQFNAWRSVGAVVQAMRIHQARGVDEVLLMDVTASREQRGPSLELVSRLAEGAFFPLTVGGGVRSIEDARQLLRHGADKVAVGSRPDLIEALADTFGRQAVTAVLDVLEGEVWDHVTRRKGGDPVRRARELAEAGELVVQSVERDGTMTGYDIDLIRAIAEAVEIPVVASGGCGSYEDMHEALSAGADAVAAGAMFQFRDLTPRGAAHYLADRGWEVRDERRTG